MRLSITPISKAGRRAKLPSRMELPPEHPAVYAFLKFEDLEKVTLEMKDGTSAEYWNPPILDGGDGT